jgi:undecaprenyl-diphosphatase
MSQILEWIGSHERRFLLALALSACSVWSFVELADEIREGDTVSYDKVLLLSMRSSSDITDPVGPVFVEEMARDITGLGCVAVLTFLTLAFAGFLILQEKHRGAAYLLLAVGSGILISTALKAGFDRPRPDLVPHGSPVYSSSFPSGHSMMATLVFLTIGALVASHQSILRIKAYLLLLSVLLAFSVGLSRVYLGVHWPSDVMGGWAAGAAWALLCWAVADWLRSRGRIE